MRTLIIAEAGVNHNGDIDLAYQLIDAAAKAGADLIKFQTFNADRLVTAYAPKATYQKQFVSSEETQHAMLKRLELSYEAHKLLIIYCKSKNIGFLSTGFDLESVTFLAELGLDRFKIPSGEITNLPYLRHIGAYKKPIILSTGMSSLAEVGDVLKIIETAGTHRDDITVLHCTTEYPAPMHEVNLRAMQTIKETFNVSVGYSDHTQGIEIPIAAVAMGAEIIEKHFTLDRNLPGPDHKASLEPSEFRRMVLAIRNIEQALGDGIKCPSASEIKNKLIVRKSLVAAKEIQFGELFSEHNLAIKRPGTGLSPMCWDQVLGRKSPRKFAIDELIEL